MRGEPGPCFMGAGRTCCRLQQPSAVLLGYAIEVVTIPAGCNEIISLALQQAQATKWAMPYRWSRNTCKQQQLI